MPEAQFTEVDLAQLYDRFYPPEERADFAFYLPLVMEAASVLDVGCGTGALLRMARAAGHTGHLCGLDPAPGMLQQARVQTDIEWVLGDLSIARRQDAFDLVIMTGHAFQELVHDEEIRAALAAVHAALGPAGRFVFETRNPLRRAWEHWPRQYSGAATDRNGVVVHRAYRVSAPGPDSVVHSTNIFTSAAWQAPRVSRGALRFLSRAQLAAALSAAGLAIEQQFGDWSGGPCSEESAEIITIAGRR